MTKLLADDGTTASDLVDAQTISGASSQTPTAFLGPQLMTPIGGGVIYTYLLHDPQDPSANIASQLTGSSAIPAGGTNYQAWAPGLPTALNVNVSAQAAGTTEQIAFGTTPEPPMNGQLPMGPPSEDTHSIVSVPVGQSGGILNDIGAAITNLVDSIGKFLDSIPGWISDFGNWMNGQVAAGGGGGSGGGGDAVVTPSLDSVMKTWAHTPQAAGSERFLLEQNPITGETSGMLSHSALHSPSMF